MASACFCRECWERVKSGTGIGAFHGGPYGCVRATGFRRSLVLTVLTIGLEMMMGEGSGEMDLRTVLNLLTSDRRPARVGE